MDARSFDGLTRHVMTRLSRRGGLGLAVGGAASLLLGGTSRVGAGCKKAGKTCDRNKDCCKNARCGGKRCTCKSGFTECGGKCFNLDNDEQHCGSCDTACAAGDRCVAGVCAEGGCTAALDSCAEGALCISCPDRADAVCYLDNDGQARCSRFLVCMPCEDDADCGEVASNARCLVDCSGQCSGTACVSD